MSARQTVALHRGKDHHRAASARARLAEALPGASVGEPDEQGIFEVGLEAESGERALDRVRDAVAAAGADDHMSFAEHPDTARHWQRPGGDPGAP